MTIGPYGGHNHGERRMRPLLALALSSLLLCGTAVGQAPYTPPPPDGRDWFSPTTRYQHRGQVGGVWNGYGWTYRCVAQMWRRWTP